MLGYTNTMYDFFGTFEIAAESTTGDIVNDQIFERNRKIEEKYNVKITEYKETNDDIGKNTAEHLRQIIASDEDLYDLAFVYVLSVGTLAREGAFWNLNDVDNIDFSKAWWNKELNDTLAISDKLYFTASDFSLRDKSRAYILAFNKNMIESNSLEDPFALVRDGKWVIDTMNEWEIAASHDANGNGEVDDQDVFGLCCDSNKAFYALTAGCGVTTTSRGDDGSIVLSLNNENTIKAIEKIRQTFNKDTISVRPEAWKSPVDYDIWSVPTKIFREGRGLFQTTFPQGLKSMSANCVDDYGILPFPKLDETQDGYYTFADVFCMMFGIPSICKDPDFAGFMLEAISAYSTDTTLKAYYETSCKTKYTYDENSAEMLDLCFSGIRYDLTMIYNIKGMSGFLENIAAKESINFSSRYAALEPAALKDLEALIEDMSN